MDGERSNDGGVDCNPEQHAPSQLPAARLRRDMLGDEITITQGALSRLGILLRHEEAVAWPGGL